MRHLTWHEKSVVLRRANRAAPEECCGLIAAPAGGGTALYFYDLDNVADDPTVAFKMAPEQLVAKLHELKLSSRTVVGVYHSHPTSGDPRPSETDREMAKQWPGLTWVIVGLGDALGAWEVWEGVLAPA